MNWMRALAISVESGFTNSNLRSRFAAVARRQANQEADTLAFAMLLLAAHSVASLRVMSGVPASAYDLVRSAIVSWYYAVYQSSKAMIAAASGADPQTHAKTARVLQADVVARSLLVFPFDFAIVGVTTTTVKAAIGALGKTHPTALQNEPTDGASAKDCLIQYLSGTAAYSRWEAENEVRESREFKALNVSDFRTHAARRIRDEALSREVVNFLVQAARYRGKANYRDAIYLSYGANYGPSIQRLVGDLHDVANAYVRMAAHYVSRRVECGSWQQFVTDVLAHGRNSGAALLELK